MQAEVTVSALGSGGDGVVDQDGKRRFIPYALPGERLALDDAAADKVSLLEPSPARVEPPCRLHGSVGRPGCGGCRLQHLPETDYVTWKHGLVTAALRRTGLACDVEPLRLSPPNSRRRASLTMERYGAHTAVGFNRRGTHGVVDMTMCLILCPELFALVDPLRRLPLLRNRERADALLTLSGGSIDLLVERRRPLELAEREALAELADRFDLARISWRPGPRAEAEPVAHRRSFTARFGTALVSLPPAGFLQATEQGEQALTDIALAAIPSGARTLDLFAGSGTFTFAAATKGRVHAVEANAEAVASIRNAGQSGITAEQRDLFRDPVVEFGGYDAVIFDPPYAGGEAQAAVLAASAVPLVVGMACNPVSFARDARLLADGGYRLDRVVPVDQFLWSTDVEIGAVFRR